MIAKNKEEGKLRFRKDVERFFMKGMWLRWLSFLFVGGVCLIALMLPMEYYPYSVRRFFYLHQWSDDVSHILLFSGAMVVSPHWLGIRKATAVFIFILMAFTTELLQDLTGRSATLLDMMMDGLGIAIGFFVLVILELLFRRSTFDESCSEQ